jgi:hypothetical protein
VTSPNQPVEATETGSLGLSMETADVTGASGLRASPDVRRRSHVMRKKVVISVSLLTILVAAALLWPTAGYDISRVHPSLYELATPYQSVSTSYYLDGGSIGITIIDRDARRLELALPVSSGRSRRYPNLFIGATHSSETGAVEVEFSEDTRRMLISVIERHGTAAGSSDIALVSLRGSPRDYARICSRAAVSFCQGFTRGHPCRLTPIKPARSIGKKHPKGDFSFPLTSAERELRLGFG